MPLLFACNKIRFSRDHSFYHISTKSLLGNFFMLFGRLLIFFIKINLSKKNSFRHTFRVSNSLDPDLAQHFVGPDLGPNCLQRLSADDTSR